MQHKRVCEGLLASPDTALSTCCKTIESSSIVHFHKTRSGVDGSTALACALALNYILVPFLAVALNWCWTTFVLLRGSCLLASFLITIHRFSTEK